MSMMTHAPQILLESTKIYTEFPEHCNNMKSTSANSQRCVKVLCTGSRVRMILQDI